MEYGSLIEARKTLRLQWYRCPVDTKVLRTLMEPSNTQGFIQAGGHLLIFVCTGILTLYFFHQEYWLAFILALFIHCTCSSFFKGMAAHELGHGTVFRTKWLNRLFLYIYSLIGWHNFHEYAMSHTYHHRYTLHPSGDREVVLPLRIAIGNPLYLLQLFTFNFVGGPVTHGMIPVIKGTLQTACGGFGSATNSREWSTALYTTHPSEHRQAITWARLVLLFHCSIIIFSVIFQLWALPFVLTLHSFTANWLRYIVGLPMHSGLRSNVPDFRKCVRSITLDPISEFLYWRMNWHLEHHMFAGIPCYNLKKLHQIVAEDMPKPRTLIGAWKEMLEIKRRQEIDPSYEYDTPVPLADSTKRKDPHSIAESIGDLAPKALG